MTIDEFWLALGRCRPARPVDATFHLEFATSLRGFLDSLTKDELVEFERHFWTIVRQAYRASLWNVAMIVCEGTGDDDFTDFRAWLISEGRDAFQRALANPASILDLLQNGRNYPSFGEFIGVARAVYERKYGTFPKLDLGPAPELDGELIEDEEGLAAMYPEIWKRYGE